MRKVVFFFLVVLVCGSLHAQPGDSTQNAKVYFMRSTGFTGSAQGFTVFIDDVVVCKLNNKRFSIHDVAPGKHIFSVQFAGKSYIETWHGEFFQ